VAAGEAGAAEVGGKGAAAVGGKGAAAVGGKEDRFYVTRAELIGLVDEAIKARGIA
jgi:hypothetical protein